MKFTFIFYTLIKILNFLFFKFKKRISWSSNDIKSRLSYKYLSDKILIKMIVKLSFLFLSFIKKLVNTKRISDLKQNTNNYFNNKFFKVLFKNLFNYFTFNRFIKYENDSWHTLGNKSHNFIDKNVLNEKNKMSIYLIKKISMNTGVSRVRRFKLYIFIFNNMFWIALGVAKKINFIKCLNQAILNSIKHVMFFNLNNKYSYSTHDLLVFQSNYKNTNQSYLNMILQNSILQKIENVYIRKKINKIKLINLLKTNFKLLQIDNFKKINLINTAFYMNF